MKEHKEQVLTALNQEAKNTTAIYLADVAKAQGVNKLSRQEALEIAKRFQRDNPTYRAYQDTDKPGPDFNQILLSENEYDKER